jgi:palmitoyltransferase
VSMLRMKAFLSLLVLAIITVIFSALPILPVLASHIESAVNVSKFDRWARSFWWDWKGSWVVFCGPFGRWPIGALLGFRILKTTRDPPNSFPGQVVEQPHLRMAMLAVVSVFIVFSCTGLVFMSVRNIHLGTTTLEMRRPGRERFVCIPDQGSRVHAVPPGERLSDLTPRQNWRRFMVRPFMGEGPTSLFPKLNPNIYLVSKNHDYQI